MHCYLTDDKVAAIHTHSNYRNLVGMGEMVAVLNGVEFRTRHNDYKLRMPSTTSSQYGATEEIPYPQVPPAVSVSTPHYLITRTLLIIDYILALINYRCICRYDYFVKEIYFVGFGEADSGRTDHRVERMVQSMERVGSFSP